MPKKPNSQVGNVGIPVPDEVMKIFVEKLDGHDLSLMAFVSKELWMLSKSGRRLGLRMESVVGSGLESVFWARSLAWPQAWTNNICKEAARAGNLAVLQWLVANGCKCDTSTCGGAAAGGHLEALQWLVDNGCTWDTSTCACAAEGGHLEVLQWARANGCRWNASTCACAAEGGHLEVLQWARANGCPWYKSTCTMAAKGGHLEVLQWARANGCQWDEWA